MNILLSLTWALNSQDAIRRYVCSTIMRWCLYTCCSQTSSSFSALGCEVSFFLRRFSDACSCSSRWASSSCGIASCTRASFIICRILPAFERVFRTDAPSRSSSLVKMSELVLRILPERRRNSRMSSPLALLRRRKQEPILSVILPSMMCSVYVKRVTSKL